MADTRETLRALEKCWYREMEGAAAYRTLAQREKDDRRRDILNKLADAEVGHAEKWAGRIRELGGTVPDPSTVKPGLGLSLQVASPEVIFRKLEAFEDRDIAAYEGLTSVLDDKSLPHSRSPATHLLEEGYDIEGYDIFLDKAGTLT